MAERKTPDKISVASQNYKATVMLLAKKKGK